MGGSTISIGVMDRLLDELARHCSFSNFGSGTSVHRTQRLNCSDLHAFADGPQNPRPRQTILREIYSTSNLSPSSLSTITQIILSDLRPIVCPLPCGTFHPSLALQISATSKPPCQLDVFGAMVVWDWEMRGLYRVCGDLEFVCREIEARGGGAGRRLKGSVILQEPVVGINVEVSNSCVRVPVLQSY